jgi:hypothetical protein
MSNFNDEFCEYNYSTFITKKLMHNRQVAVQYGECHSNCYSSYQMYKNESMFDMNKCITDCEDIWKTYEK